MASGWSPSRSRTVDPRTVRARRARDLLVLAVVACATPSWGAYALKTSLPNNGAGGRAGSAVAIVGPNVYVGIPGQNRVNVHDRLSGAVVKSFLSPTGGAGDDFGASVAIAGTVVLVGAPGENDGATADAGAVYVMDDDTGAVLVRLTQPTPAANSGFGNAVAFGLQQIIVGASLDDTDAADAGGVYVFESAAPYDYVQRLANPTPAASDGFGTALLPGGFGTLAVGAPFDDTAATDSGAVYVYFPTTFDPPFTLGLTTTYPNPSGAPTEWFGFSLATGPTIPIGGPSDPDHSSYVVGAPLATGAATASGRAYVLDLQASTIVGTMQRPSGAAGLDFFGWSVAIVNGNIVVTAPGADVGATDAGEAYQFAPTSPYGWVQTLANPAPAAGDLFGIAARGGTRLAIGARDDDALATNGGAAYLFETAFATSCWTSAAASSVGAWETAESWPIAATHSTLLHTADHAGKILFFHGHGVSPTWIWDAATGEVRSSGTANGSTFCGGHVTMKDGRLIQVGGTPITFGNPEEAGGLDLNNVFDPVTETWSVKNSMIYDRWYPTATELGDGRVLVSQGTDGQIGGTPVVRTTPEVYDPRRDCWRAVTPSSALETETYPMMFLLPNGKLFQAGRSGGGSTMTRTFTLSVGPRDAACTDAASGTWADVGNSGFDASHGSAVLYRAREHSGSNVVAAAKIMKAGGTLGFGTVRNNAAIIDMEAGSPSWSAVSALNAARADHNLVVLPTGQILAVGGSGGAAGPVLGAELWTPPSGTWTKMACMSEPRMYHSTVLLLPDATVLAAGGDPLFGPADYPSYQIYKPAYLFSGQPRATITSAPAEATYGNTFEVGVGTVGAADIDQVVLIRPGSVTHAFDMSQRYVPVAFDVKNSTTLTVTAPAADTIAPEGFYMLFLVKDGVPSKAVFVALAPAPSILGTYDSTGTVDANDVFVLGNYAYLGTDANGGGPELYVVNVSNPASPTLAGSFEVGATVNKVVVEGNKAYLATSDNARELVIVDVTNKASPALLGSYDADEGLDGLAVAVAGNTVCLGTKNNTGVGDHELYVLDAANPASVSLLGSHDVAEDVNDIDLNGETAFLAASPGGVAEIIELDIATPASIAVVSTVDFAGSGSPARGVDYHDGKLYGVMHDNGGQPDFFVWNAPPGGALTQVGAVDLGSTNRAVTVYGGRAFVATVTAAQRLTVVDVRNPAAPTREAALDLSGDAFGLAVKDARAYVATTFNTGELRIVSAGIDLEPTLTDINGDGFVTVSCLGDSNTAGSTWCAQLDGLFTQPSWRTINHGVGFATGFEVGGSWPDAFEQLPVALANDAPEAVVIAFGTNDITFDINIAASFGTVADPSWLQTTVDAYESLKATTEATGAKLFVAFTPPRNEAVSSLANHLTLHLNNRVRHEFPRERVIDFHGPIVAPTDFADLLHMNSAGHTKRAQEALHELEN